MPGLKLLSAAEVAELEHRECLDMKHTAAVLGVSISSLTVEVRAGRLECLRMGARGRRIIIPKKARERWLEQSVTSWKSADGS
jgi:hypothetical protein